jgi:serine protease inhibitor
VRDLDFDQPWAADTINHWVDVNTNGKITDIITPPINPLTVMFLINAIYFKGNWTLPFDTGSTQMTPFQLGNGSYEDRPLMRTDTVLSYYKNDLFQAVDLPYGNKDFSMTILLPAYGHTVDEIINQLSDETVAAWMAGFDTTKVMLGVPKFKFKYEAKLNDMLSAMGMRIAFDPDYADFTNMVGDPVLGQNLHISQVKHKAFVQVDEVGTEAAAVTVVEIQLDSMPEEEIMYITRPFLFVIREHKTGTILFISKVVDPVWES